MNATLNIQQVPRVVDYSDKPTLAGAQIIRGKRTYPRTYWHVPASEATTFNKIVWHFAKLPPRDFRFETVYRFNWAPDTSISDAITFELLADRWKRETGRFSIVQQKILHPAYQEIIGMGERALPMLIREIQTAPSHWFWALRAIARDNPAQGKATIEEAVTAWTRWWSSRTKRYAPMDFAR